MIALESLGLEHAAPVLVPALTWTASATAVFRAGLVPVLVDVDQATGCLDPAAVAAETEAAAVIAVHWACTMADVPALIAAAEALGAGVIEDAAQAHGARWLGRPAGSLGDGRMLQHAALQSAHLRRRRRRLSPTTPNAPD